MEANKKISQQLLSLRAKKPLVHHITNYVTANDCANITLAIGASPVMADEICEVEEIVAISSALVVNIGTLNQQKLQSMLKASIKANQLGIPVVLDPVGVAATSFREQAVREILNKVKVSVIKGNLAEIKAIYGLQGKSRGVDSIEVVGTDTQDALEAINIAKELALKLDTCIAVTGAVDLITDGKTLYKVANGHPLMADVTGTGCMCCSLIGSYLGSGADSLTAALAGIVSMGIAGEVAFERLDKNTDGTGTLKVHMLDAISRLQEQTLLQRGKIYEEKL